MSTATRRRPTRRGSFTKKKNHGTLEAENVTSTSTSTSNTSTRTESTHIIEESPKKRTRQKSPISNNDKIIPPSFDFPPSSPKKQTSGTGLGIVTPSTMDMAASAGAVSKSNEKFTTGSARRVLSMPPLREVSSEDATTSPESSPTDIGKTNEAKNFFTKSNTSYTILPKTREVYHTVNKMTGSLGGNGHGGAIYGELTIGSMQKMIELMKVHTEFGPDSRFIDVGSGLGKPNLHVAQDPGVEFSYGIEMEHVRWALGMSNLNKVLELGQKQQGESNVKESYRIGHRCTFQHGDITEATFFDPFTHVYMFDIGFPPKLFKQLAEMFNRSESPYLISFQPPRVLIDKYAFDIELIVQAQTSMHGSSEGHSGYIYKRVMKKTRTRRSRTTKSDCRNYDVIPNCVPCDPLFAPAWKSTRRDIDALRKDVKDQVMKNLSSRRPRRSQRAVTFDPYVSAWSQST